ncbi:MAG: hypothetical protein R3F02_18760 [Thiolinea sp.]
MNQLPTLKINSRAIAVHIVMESGQYPVIRHDGFEFTGQVTDSGVCVSGKCEREWERSYQAATGSLSAFNRLLKSLGDGQRAIRNHLK